MTPDAAPRVRLYHGGTSTQVPVLVVLTCLKPRYMTLISCLVNLVCLQRSSRATGLCFGSLLGSNSYGASSIGESGGVAILCCRPPYCPGRRLQRSQRPSPAKGMRYCLQRPRGPTSPPLVSC
ncbi:unnamed protein product [Nezara viridula]|uniref:Uncharacterized protein n=1 Tax=Nezara viridula TaxID=85310 RepID=A0A9P0H9H2_NEZVI|nr:unnamed protein product [Nezara viridula]